MNTPIRSTVLLRFTRHSAIVILLAASSAAFAQAPISATAAQTSLQFNPAPIGAPASSAQTLVASFTVANYPAAPYTPTAQLHYGIAYSASAVTCTGTASPETCTVSVTFRPGFPGGRKDALLLMDGSTTLATVFLYGIGESPLALIQPGVISNPISADAGNTLQLYEIAVAEDGTTYVTSDNSASGLVFRVDNDGGVTTLPISFASYPHSMVIDGAGTLYFAQGGGGSSLIAYDGGTQGSVSIVPPGYCGGSIALYAAVTDGLGDLFAAELECNSILELQVDGGYVVTPINPYIQQPSTLAIDSTGNLFIGGNDAINELQIDGGQEEINTLTAKFGLAVDVADTIYTTENSGVGAVEFAAADYTTQLTVLDNSSSLGVGFGADGTAYVSDYYDLDKIDRSQGLIDFGQLEVEPAIEKQVILYNGGNETLHVSNLQLTGDGFTLDPASTTCASADSLAPGSICAFAVSFAALHGGTFTGALTFSSDSLNNSATVSHIALVARVFGIYVVATPDPVTFPAQTVNTTSAPITVTLTNDGYYFAAYTNTPVSDNAAFAVGLGTCSSLIAPGQSCALSVTFSPTAAQAYSGMISVSEGSNDNNQTYAIAVSGTGAAVVPLAPVASLPPSVAFPDTAVGTTSPVQSIVATNLGNAPLTISNIAFSGSTSFVRKSVSTDCGTSLAVNESCTISLAFAPGSVGPFTGTVTVTDDAAGSPQTIALSGNGIAAVVTTPADFTVSATPGIEGIGAGASATFAVTVSATGGSFDSPVALSVSGLPADANGTFAPTSVTPGASSGASTLSVQTHTGDASARKPGSPKSDPSNPWLAALCFLPVFGFGQLRRALGKPHLRSGLLIFAVLSQSFLGCGTKALKSYSVTITGTSGATAHSTVVTLTVE